MRGGARQGAGRRKGPAKVPLRLRVLPETFRTLDLLAFAKSQSRGEIVDQMARRAVRKKPPCAPTKVTAPKSP
jgi:hypothetical protein